MRLFALLIISLSLFVSAIAYGAATYDNSTKIITITSDGDYVLYPKVNSAGAATGSPAQHKDNSAITVESNLDVATLTVGYRDSTGSFKAYTNGTVTIATDAYVKHVKGVVLMIQVTGITANSVIVRYGN